ncbi:MULTISPECIES: DHA2 family efflux MFS transporter permease subunit [Brevibacillus]|uniref:MFS transporter n=1 Tax=Brevibacillus parabrevis TaxID=54914 RepID=A0A4Y3PLI1_BREPA|nr:MULTISPECIES: DHA2 family efflux MFS transporter permease subunit [Brevibacillus]MBU8714535.1 DHA2 family efflux MFS transporter permease subunit [Brevibacillus parabrevis]MDH6351241.1 EmrB/QacA subfamily drug resistance transporter [Brevibacillus sp. 1238]MDR4998623.1 DHA2 family efflux MFS transporter permease subunit [Brevibacillus parabrevis]MED2254756.1 DHA2 family efflux MFS transporter permease subunit [Brevibacillus parabrevis]NRQ54314.1 DHA2 family efflux MFS transporter permease s
MTNEQGATETNIQRAPILGVIIAGAIAALLNQTLLNVALPKLMEQFHITTSTAQWVITIYMLVNGVLIPTTAFLMEKYTTRQLFISAMSLFAAGTLICGIAPSFSIMLIGRVVQAAGAGILMPLMTNVIFNMFPADRRGSAMGIVGIAMVFAPAIGPTLSGWIVEHYSWRLLFFVVLPIALIVLVTSFFVLKNVTETQNPKLDSWGVVLSTIGFGGLLYGFSSAGAAGWRSAEVIGMLLVGCISLGAFVWRQLSIDHAMLEFRIFQTPAYTLAVLISLMVNMSLYSGMILLPVYVQNILHFTPVQSGLLLLPGSIIMGIMSPITGKLFDKFGAKWLALIGLIITIVTTYGFTKLSLSTSYSYLVTLYTVRMFGLSMLMMPVMTSGLNALPLQLNPHGTAMSNTINAIGGALGTALFVTIMTTKSAAHTADIVRSQHLNPADLAQMQLATKQGIAMGTNDAFMIATLFTVIALVLALFLGNKTPRRQEAAAQKRVPQPS